MAIIEICRGLQVYTTYCHVLAGMVVKKGSSCFAECVPMLKNTCFSGKIMCTFSCRNVKINKIMGQ